MQIEIKQAVILAGGRGTRLQPYTDSMPKPMYPFRGKPFLEYLIEQVKSFGIGEIVLLLGYLPDKIMEYFGDGSEWGVSIIYSVTPEGNDTGVRLREAQGLLKDDFLLLYCDNYCPINFNCAAQQYVEGDCYLQVTAYTNKDGYTKNNIKYDKSGHVIVYDKARVTENLQAVDIGYIFMNKEVLSLIPIENVNFEKAVYPVLVNDGKLGVFLTDHRYYSVGSWARISLTEDFFSDKKVIFLDRDGTLNEKAPKAQYIETPSQFIWLNGAKEAVKKLKDKGYTICLITNQPGIARGMLTIEDLDRIHRKMQEDLEAVGATIDKIYICPHGWDDGCDCRKPKPGLLYQAQRELSVDLTKCIFIGDDERDIVAGEAAGCKSILVDENYTLLSAVEQILMLK